MSIEYRTGGQMYTFHYQHMKNLHNHICTFDDELFLKRLPEILHLACSICYFKGLDPECTIGDKGVIHEMVHLLHMPDQNVISVSAVRELFERHCKLA